MSRYCGGLSQLLRAWKYNTARAACQNSEATSKATPTSLSAMALLCAMCMAGCAGATGRKILTSANGFEVVNGDYTVRCVTVVGSNCKPCYSALVTWRSALDDASAAYKRGGKSPDQITALQAAEKAARSACRQ